ncbi:unnamed protein product, partial [Larinioides sclopetarius]
MRTLLVETLNVDIQNAFSKVKSSFEEFEARGSGWIIDFIEHLELKVATYIPFAGSSYIPTPVKLKCTGGLINVQNNDNKCFMWSMLAALHPAKTNVHRVSNYVEYVDELKFESDMTFPFTINKVPKFETLNNISINVYGYEETLFPLYISDKFCATHINLLFLSNTETNHFCYIKNMSRLLSHLSKHNGKAFYCNYCLHRCSSQATLDNHLSYCQHHKPQAIEMPADTHLSFENYHFQLPVPFVIYADFESIITPNTQQVNSVSIHEPCGFCYVVIGPDGKSFKPPVVYRGERAAAMFIASLLKEEDEISAILKKNTPMSITDEEEKLFISAVNCHICGAELKKDKVRDHDHL